MDSDSKKETLRKANKEVFGYQHTVEAEIDPYVKAVYSETFERWVSP